MSCVVLADPRRNQVVRVARVSPGVLIMSSQKHLDARREGAVGKVISVVGRGDLTVVWVQHGRTTAPYLPFELALVGEPCDE